MVKSTATKTAIKTSKKKKNTDDCEYTDIKLKNKDYNNDKNLAFFIEQKRKAEKMLQEVNNFNKSFVLSKFKDFDYVLSILEHVNWIDFQKIENAYKFGMSHLAHIFIPSIDNISE